MLREGPDLKGLLTTVAVAVTVVEGPFWVTVAGLVTVTVLVVVVGAPGLVTVTCLQVEVEVTVLVEVTVVEHRTLTGYWFVRFTLCDDLNTTRGGPPATGVTSTSAKSRARRTGETLLTSRFFSDKLSPGMVSRAGRKPAGVGTMKLVATVVVVVSVSVTVYEE